MTLILFEGPDGGGKTYAAQKGFPDYAYQHNGPPSPAWDRDRVFRWQLDGLLEAEPATGKWAVDRNWPSEQIYHRFAGRPDVFDPVAQRAFERVVLTHGGVVVMCLPPYRTAWEVWRARADEGSELLTEDRQFAAMYHFYRAWQHSTCLPTVAFDREAHGLGWLQEAVWRRQESREPCPVPGVAGNWLAPILVVGRGEGRYHFVDDGQDGRWLGFELEKLGIPEASLAWASCRTLDQSALADLPARTVVALGAEAFEWALGAKAKGRRVLSAPHPSDWRGRAAPWELHLHRLYLRETARELFL